MSAGGGASESRRDYPTLIRGGLIVVPEAGEGLQAISGDLLMEGERIARLGALERPPRGTRTIYAGGCAVVPGFVQSHVHLSHGLFRGLAEDTGSRAALRRRVLALEAAHTPGSMRASARLGVAELLLGGTTAVQAMESVHHTGTVFEVLGEAGLYALVGKSLFDRDGGPPGLVQSTERALREAVDLAEKWDGAAAGRLRACLAPRTVSACTETCLQEVARLADAGGWRVQIESEDAPADGSADHVSDVEALERHGLLGPSLGLAHCAPSADARRRLARAGAHLLHCPGSEARRGVAAPPLAGLRREGLEVSLGTDGAAGGGSSLDMFQELRLVTLLQQAATGPDALPPAVALDMATRAGAAALGRAGELGELREGAVANVVLVSLEGPHTTPGPDPLGALVHGGRSADIRAVWLAGRQVVSEGRLTLWDEEELCRDARKEARALAARV